MNKIDLIIDALEQADRMRRKQGYTEEYLQEALAAAREIKALKPAAWAAKSIYGAWYEGLSFDKQPRFNTPLYALEVTK
jgi:hypothetical protein